MCLWCAAWTGRGLCFVSCHVHHPWFPGSHQSCGHSVLQEMWWHEVHLQPFCWWWFILNWAWLLQSNLSAPRENNDMPAALDRMDWFVYVRIQKTLLKSRNTCCLAVVHRAGRINPIVFKCYMNFHSLWFNHCSIDSVWPCASSFSCAVWLLEWNSKQQVLSCQREASHSKFCPGMQSEQWRNNNFLLDRRLVMKLGLQEYKSLCIHLLWICDRPSSFDCEDPCPAQGLAHVSPL